MTDNAPGQSAPDTIVLVHGFWVTPLSWEKWVKRYEAKGYRVLTPTCPGFEGGVEALREDPSPIEALTFPAVVEHIGGIIDGLEKPPDHHRSLGGRRAHPDPPRPRLRRRRCCHRLGPGRGRQGGARLADPGALPHPQEPLQPPQGRGPHPRAEWHYAFANTLGREESDEAFERYHIPASGRLVWVGATANFTPGHQEAYVDFENEDRAPLLFIAGK